MLKTHHLLTRTLSQHLLSRFKPVYDKNPCIHYVQTCNFARRVGKTAKSNTQEGAPREEGEYSTHIRDKADKDDAEDFDDIEEQSQERALIEKINSTQYDDEVQDELVKLMREGRDDNEILAAMLGSTISPKKREELKPKKPTGEESSFLEDFLTLGSGSKATREAMGLPAPSREEKQAAERIKKELEQLRLISEATETSTKTPLTSSPLKNYLGGKLTPQMKEDLKLQIALKQPSPQEEQNQGSKNKKKAIVQEDDDFESISLFNSGENQPENKEVASHKNKTKDEMTMSERKLKTNLEIANRELVSTNDDEFYKIAKSDLKEAAKAMDIYVEEGKTGDSRLSRSKKSSDLTLYQKSQNEIARRIEEGWDPAIAKQDMKTFIFEMKKLDEENSKYKQYLERKEKQRKINQLMKETQKLDDFSEDINYNESTAKLKKKFNVDMYGVPEKWEEYEKYVEEHNKNEGPPSQYDVFKMRTDTNIVGYLHEFFLRPKQSFKGVTLQKELVIREITTNDAITVINIFWSLRDDRDPTVYLPKEHKVIGIVSKNLKKFSKYLRGKMCREMGFRYAPDLRFFHSDLDKKSKEIRDDFLKMAPDIYEKRLKDDFKAGKSLKDPRILVRNLEDEIELQVDDFIENYSHEKQLSEKKKDLQLQKEKDKRENRNKHTKSKSMLKQSRHERDTNKAEKFWRSLKV